MTRRLPVRTLTFACLATLPVWAAGGQSSVDFRVTVQPQFAQPSATCRTDEPLPLVSCTAAGGRAGTFLTRVDTFGTIVRPMVLGSGETFNATSAETRVVVTDEREYLELLLSW